MTARRRTNPKPSSTSPSGLSIIYKFTAQPDAYQAMAEILHQAWLDADYHQRTKGAQEPVGSNKLYHWGRFISVTSLTINPKPTLTWKMWADAAQKMEQFVSRAKPTAEFEYSVFQEGIQGSVGNGKLWSDDIGVLLASSSDG